MQQQARSFAIAAHGNQKYGDRPYPFHLDAVANLAEPYGEEAMVVAYLHDTAEDTTATVQEIESTFGPKIAACVSLLTDEPGANRKERKAKTYAKLAGVEDRKQSLWELYRSEHQVFRSAAYRDGLCEPLWAELDSLLSGGGFDART